MKIRILKPSGEHKKGDIVDAINRPSSSTYAAYDANGIIQYYFTDADVSCEIVVFSETLHEDESSFPNYTITTTTQPVQMQSLADIFGQDIKKITVEF